MKAQVKAIEECHMYFTRAETRKEVRVRIVPSLLDLTLFNLEIYDGERLPAVAQVPWSVLGRGLSHKEVLADFIELCRTNIIYGYTDHPSGHPGTHSGILLGTPCKFIQTIFHAWPEASRPKAMMSGSSPLSHASILYSAPPQKLSNPDHEDDVLLCFGIPLVFQPAQLPVPNWAILVNPDGEGGAEISEEDASGNFAPHCTYTSMYLMKGNLADVVPLLHQSALDDASSHKATNNGGAYTVWTIDTDHILVAGFDNGGSDMAFSSIEAAVDVLNKANPTRFEIIATLKRSSFNTSALYGSTLPWDQQITHALTKMNASRRLEELSHLVVKTPHTSLPTPKF